MSHSLIQTAVCRQLWIWGDEKRIRSLSAELRDSLPRGTYATKPGMFYTSVVAVYLQLLERLNSRATHKDFRCDKQSRRNFRGIYPSGKRRHLPSIYLILKPYSGRIFTSQPPQAARLGSCHCLLGSPLLFSEGFARATRRDRCGFQTQNKLCLTGRRQEGSQQEISPTSWYTRM